MRDWFIGVNMKPALSALVRGPGVPAKAQVSESARWETDEVLLQWSNSENVIDLELLNGAVLTFGLNYKRVATLEKTGFEPEMSEFGVFEITQDSFVTYFLHGQIVIGACPQFHLARMAADASGTTDITRAVEV